MEDIRSKVQRAREIAAKLAEATDALNDALRRWEAALVGRLGPNARGRTRLRLNKDGWIEHLVFRDGHLFYENGWPGEPLQVTLLLQSSRETRFLAAGKLPELWVACGGAPLPTTRP